MLWNFFRQYFVEKWPHYNGTALYDATIIYRSITWKFTEMYHSIHCPHCHWHLNHTPEVVSACQTLYRHFHMHCSKQNMLISVKISLRFSPRNQFSVNPHWFGLCLYAKQATSRYQNQWWPILLTHICVRNGIYYIISSWVCLLFYQFIINLFFMFPRVSRIQASSHDGTKKNSPEWRSVMICVFSLSMKYSCSHSLKMIFWTYFEQSRYVHVIFSY